MALGKGFASLSDRGMLRLLNFLRKTVSDPGIREGLEELIEAIEEGPPNTDTLRRMLNDSKYFELREFIEGQFFFRNFDIADH